MSTGGYPPGAEYDPYAPWNISDNREVEVDIDVTLTLGKTTTVKATNYNASTWYDEESDEEGYIHRSSGTDYEFDDLYTDYNNCEYSVIQMLGMLKKYVQRDLDNGDFSLFKKYELKDIMTSADGWEEVEIDIEED